VYFGSGQQHMVKAAGMKAYTITIMLSHVVPRSENMGAAAANDDNNSNNQMSESPCCCND
jgi:hypothetical protein